MQQALITGASGGIGKSFARALAAEGWTITLVARNQEKMQALVRELPGSGHRALRADLSEAAGVQTIVSELQAQHYDLLINNAGSGLYGPFADSDWQTLASMQRLNCDALVELSHVYLRNAAEGSALINVSSVLGFVPYPEGGALYAATKSYVLSLSLSLWKEVRTRGVYVMALCPGVTRTDFFERAGGDMHNQPPSIITQTPEQVVKTAMRALRRRRQPVVITGAGNRAFVWLTRLLPYRFLAALMRLAKPPMRTDS